MTAGVHGRRDEEEEELLAAYGALEQREQDLLLRIARAFADAYRFGEAWPSHRPGPADPAAN